jgi:threonine aldolase
MRLAGVLAAAGIFALEQMVERLAEDHAHCKLLAEGLASFPQIVIEPARVVTDILIFTLQDGNNQQLTESEIVHFIARASKHGVLLSHMGGGTVRAVTHYGIEQQHIAAALTSIEQTLLDMHI